VPEDLAGRQVTLAKEPRELRELLLWNAREERYGG